MPSASRKNPVRRRVWNVGRFLVVLGALAATFGIFFFAGLRVATHARDVTVPDLHGKSVTDANTVLTNLGLVLRVDEPRRPDKTVPADHVLTQEPEAGSVVRKTRAVRVRVSDGQSDPVTPVVTKLPESTAQDTLAADHLSVGYRAEVRSINYPAGTVVAQDPDAGQRSGTVNLLINRGDANAAYVVPDLIGTLASKAADTLRSQNFRVAVSAEVPYPGLPPGVVVRQTPQAGYRIQQTETITIEVSK
jgi:eukaryotic-like serine/threonine-protein kinase